jgi:Flp pilus assembly protein TadG
MKAIRHERGQALILIALAAVGLFGFTALAIDGSRKFSDRRHSQNAADAAALAAALASSRGADDTSSSTTATTVATTNGYDGGATNDVTVIFTDTPAGLCPPNTTGKDITVNIDSVIPTTFARVVNVNQMTNKVSATARECGSFIGPPFEGNAIVALAPAGKGFDGTGTPDWLITGGGIFSNSADGNAAYCNGSAGIITPSVSVVGGTDFRCHGTSSYGTVDDTKPQYTSVQIKALLPPVPACDGVASLS